MKGERADAEPAEAQAEDGAAGHEEAALGEQLLHESSPPSAEHRAQSDLTATLLRTREEITSVLGVTDQLLNFLTRRNSLEQLVHYTIEREK